MPLQQIIDRRLSGKNKSIGNRERFLRRHKDQIREAVKRAVDGRGIRDMEKGEDIHIPRRDISEPVFGHGQGGKREMVHPGNQDYVRGEPVRPHRPGSAKAAEDLSTGLAPNLAPTVDNPPAGHWLGCVVPKRHAKRSVTRTVLKRQIRAAVYDEKRKQAFNDYFEKLKKQYNIRVNSSALQ